METVKKTVGTFFGLSSVETEMLIADAKQRVLPVVTTVIRILFVLSFLYCFFVYTAIGMIMLVLAYYIIQLERRVDNLERKIKESNNQQWFY